MSLNDKKVFACGKILLKLREKAGLSQASLSKAIGVSQSTYAKWENGTRIPKLDSLTMLALQFKASINYLLGNDDIPIENGSLANMMALSASSKRIISESDDDESHWDDAEYWRRKYRVEHEKFLVAQGNLDSLIKTIPASREGCQKSAGAGGASATKTA